MPAPRLTASALLAALPQMDVIAHEPLGSSARQLAAVLAPNCDHKVSTVLDSMGGGLDDHQTFYMRCLHCAASFVVTSFASRADAEIRLMTDKERARYVR